VRDTPTRLVPDALAAFSQQRPLQLRQPRAIRPWQHVLEPLHGYLQLAQKLYQEGHQKEHQKEHQKGHEWGCAWNFGPPLDDVLSAESLVALLARYWPHAVQWHSAAPTAALHENAVLRLDSSKAHQWLGWQSVWRIHTALQKTVQWHQQSLGGHALECCCQQLREFLHDACTTSLSDTQP